MKKYFYVTVWDREVCALTIFNSFDEARKQMVEDFIHYASEDGRFDDREDINVESLMLIKEYEEYEECGIDIDNAWINDTYTHADWTASIFEVGI